MAGVFNRLAVEQALEAEAGILVALSRLVYVGLSGMGRWTPSFVDEVHKALKEDRSRARELLAPFVKGGETKVYDMDLDTLEELLDKLAGRGYAFESAMDLNLQKETGLESFFVTSDKVLTIVFCGSDDWRDWKENLSMAQMDVRSQTQMSSLTTWVCGNVEEGVAVHSGFWDQYTTQGSRAKLLEWVLAHLKERPNIEVHITGHSLGGALATLCGWDLAPKVKNKILVLNFACPRVGNRAFVRSCASMENMRVIRVKRNDDPVTTVPFAGYEHTGDVAWIRHGRVHIIEGECWEEFLRSIPLALRCCGVSAGFVFTLDHLIEGYYATVIKHYPLKEVTKDPKADPASLWNAEEPAKVAKASAAEADPASLWNNAEEPAKADQADSPKRAASCRQVEARQMEEGACEAPTAPGLMQAAAEAGRRGGDAVAGGPSTSIVRL